MDEPTLRNERPFVKAFGIAFALVVLLFLTLQFRGGSAAAFNMAGELSFQIVVGATAVGVWGKRARTRWSAIGYTWRFILCFAVTFLVTSFLIVAGRR